MFASSYTQPSKDLRIRAPWCVRRKPEAQPACRTHHRHPWRSGRPLEALRPGLRGDALRAPRRTRGEGGHTQRASVGRARSRARPRAEDADPRQSHRSVLERRLAKEMFPATFWRSGRLMTWSVFMEQRGRELTVGSKISGKVSHRKRACGAERQLPRIARQKIANAVRSQ